MGGRMQVGTENTPTLGFETLCLKECEYAPFLPTAMPLGPVGGAPNPGTSAKRGQDKGRFCPGGPKVSHRKSCLFSTLPAHALTPGSYPTAEPALKSHPHRVLATATQA